MDEAEEEIERLEHAKKKLQRELDEQIEINEQLHGQLNTLRNEMRWRCTTCGVMYKLLLFLLPHKFILSVHRRKKKLPPLARVTEGDVNNVDGLESDWLTDKCHKDKLLSFSHFWTLLKNVWLWRSLKIIIPLTPLWLRLSAGSTASWQSWPLVATCVTTTSDKLVFYIGANLLIYLYWNWLTGYLSYLLVWVNVL